MIRTDVPISDSFVNNLRNGPISPSGKKHTPDQLSRHACKLPKIPAPDKIRNFKGLFTKPPGEKSRADRPNPFKPSGLKCYRSVTHGLPTSYSQFLVNWKSALKSWDQEKRISPFEPLKRRISSPERL